eukprot:scaffold22489_cov62-Phaeocystis_antarctica.AAC.5
MRGEEARQHAQAEGLTPFRAENTTGLANPATASLSRLRHLHLAEEAALCVARSPEGQLAVEAAAAPKPLTSEEARQQAQAEGLTLRGADNTTGYFGVCRLARPGAPKPYQARVKRGGKDVHLGGFATAEKVALCVARSPEGRAAAGRAASPAVPLLSEEEEAPAASPGSLNPVAPPRPPPAARPSRPLSPARNLSAL